MSDKLQEAMKAIAEGGPLPDGVMVHADRQTTKSDWDKLDPNSYESECAKCGAHVIGQFGPKGETETPCSQCGGTELTGGISSPAGAYHLAMFDPSMDF